jgi:hypothetical protein
MNKREAEVYKRKQEVLVVISKEIAKKVKIDENVLLFFGTTLTPKIKWAIKIFHR